MLTDNQKRLFSSEWRALIDELEGRKYELTYRAGVIEIRHAVAGVKMDVELDRSRWKMTLHKPCGLLPVIRKRREDRQIIEDIRFWVRKAEQSPFMYSFSIPRPELVIEMEVVTA